MSSLSRRIRQYLPDRDAVKHALRDAPEVEDDLSAEQLEAIAEARRELADGDAGLSTRQVLEDLDSAR